MKRLSTSIIVGLILTSSLFAASQDKLKQDISKIFTDGKLDTSSINIIAQDKSPDLKGLQVAIGTIKGNPKPFLLLYNKDTIIIGNIRDRKSGKNLFKPFIEKNKGKIQKALRNIEKQEASKEVKKNKTSISLLNNAFKDLVFKIKGGNPKGKTIYLITDPNCPYCQQYEKNRLPDVIKNSKEVRVVPLFLNIPGHETSPMRASWLLESYKNNKNADMLSLMHKASNAQDNTYKKVDKKFAKEKIAQMKKFLSKGLIQGTPTVFDENGNSAR